MLVFKPSQNLLLLLPPKISTTTNSKPSHLLLHHHHDVKLLHFSQLRKAHFIKSTLSSSSSSPLSSPAAPSSSSSSSSLTNTTVDFLMDSVGLSYEQAHHVIRQVPTLLKNGGRRPRSVIAYFESSSICFSKTHISKAISKYPRLLVADVEKTLKPKIQMFLDYGFSNSDIAELIAVNPTILTKGLKTHIKPSLDLIKSFVKTDEALLIKTIKRSGYYLLGPSRKWIEPNMDVLRQHGVPDSEILHLIVTQLPTLMSSTKVFKSIVERIVSLGGFKPETRKFVTAVVSMSQLKKATWDAKTELLKGLGWSDEQILDAFRRCPTFFTLSGEKMKEGIGYFKESLNWDASVLSRHPIILSFSLKKRVIPRYAVLKCLMSKEIIIIKEEDKLFIHMLKMNETNFLSKYVFKYQEQLPYLYEEVYKKECMLLLGGCEEEDNDEITNQQDNGDIDMST